MAQNIKSLYAVALIISFANSAYAIRCLVCDSYNDFMCSTRPNYTSAFVVDCEWISAPSYLSDGYGNLSATGCLVKDVKEYGKSIPIRTCYWSNISDQEKGCRNPPRATYTTLSCDVCDSHGCNDDSNLHYNYSVGNEMSLSCVTKSIAVLIALFFAITRWIS